MAFNRFAILIGIAMILLPSIATATDYIVGESKGWTNSGFDYQAWAKDKMFNVGDTLGILQLLIHFALFLIPNYSQ